VITLWDPHETVSLGKTQNSELISGLVAFTMSESGETIVTYSQYSDDIIAIDVSEDMVLEIPRPGNVTCLALCEAHGIFAAGCKDGAVTLWKDGSTQTYGNLHSGKILSMDIHPDGHSVATVSEDGKCVIADVQTGIPRYRERIFDSSVLGAIFTGAHGEYITAFNESGIVKTVALNDLKTVSHIRLDTQSNRRRITALRKDGLALAFIRAPYATPEIAEVEKSMDISTPLYFAGSLGMNLTGRTITDDFRLAVGIKTTNEDKTFREVLEQGLPLTSYATIIEMDTGRSLLDIYPSENASRIDHCAISEDGSLAVIVDSENVVALWDVEKQNSIAHFAWHAGIIFVTCSSKTKTVFAFDEDSNFIVARIQSCDRSL